MTATATRKPLLQRIWGVVANVLLVAGILAGLAYVAPSLAGYDRYVITGGSMTGTYDLGSLVFERRVPVADLKVGDVITYVPPASSGVHTLVTHRIVKADKAPNGARTFRTKGDANRDLDPWTFQLTAATQPVAQFGVPLVGWLLIAMADRTIRMLVVGIPAGLIALGALTELTKAIRAARRPSASPDQDSVPALAAA